MPDSDSSGHRYVNSIEAYSWFVSLFRTAAEKLKAGERNAPFPAGSFPPGLPFVVG